MTEPMKTELDDAIQKANRALDVPNADPDDDLRLISRQFLRLLEKNERQVTAERERVKELLDVLDHIANPVARLQKLAEEEGKQLNGIMALMITSDAHYYKNIAKTALEKYKLIDK